MSQPKDATTEEVTQEQSTKKQPKDVTMADALGKEFKFVPSELDEKSPHGGYSVKECPYKQVENHNYCDGSGFLKIENNGRLFTRECQCLKDYNFNTQLQRSSIETKYWNASIKRLDEKKIDATLLKPIKKPAERKFDKRKKTIEPEDPNDFIERMYTKLQQKSLSNFMERYTVGSINLLNQNPRTAVHNLMLLGEPGCGKTHAACAVGITFLKNNKTVYYTRLKSLLDDYFQDKHKIRHIFETRNLIIIDELGQEYHTDSQYSLKQIQELFKIRHDKNLPIICTTNFYPSDLAEFYGKSLMSMFHGEFFLTFLESEYDLRLENSDAAFDMFGF